MSTQPSHGEVLDEVRGYLPWMIGSIVLIFGAARIDALRPHLATAVALAVPVVAATSGVYRFRGAHQALETLALAVGGVAVVAAEALIAGGLLGMDNLTPVLTFARPALASATAAALVLHVLAVRRGLNPRFGAWIWMAAAFAWYVSSRSPGDRFSIVFAGLFVALALGGGVGSLAGEALRRGFRRS